MNVFFLIGNFVGFFPDLLKFGLFVPNSKIEDPHKSLCQGITQEHGLGCQKGEDDEWILILPCFFTKPK